METLVVCLGGVRGEPAWAGVTSMVTIVLRPQTTGHSIKPSEDEF